MPKPSKQQITDISLLRAFLQTSRTGNTRSAAKILGISQPAISGAIQRLERMIGHPLFDRNSRPMQITHIGRALAKRIEPILENLDNLPLEIESIARHSEIDLRIGFSDSMGHCVSPFLLPRILPIVDNLSCYLENTPKIYSKFLLDKIDIALATKYPRENPDVTARLLVNENYLVVTPQKYEGQIHTVNDLAILPKSLPVLRFNDDSLDSIQIERVLRQLDYRDPRYVACDSNSSILGLVSNDLGWTIMPPLGIWAGQLYVKNIALHRVDAMQSVRSIWIMYKERCYSNLADTIAQESLNILEQIVIPKMTQASEILGASVTLCKESTVAFPSRR